MRALAGLLLAGAAAAGEYAGKYRDDPRLAPIVAELPARAERARTRLAEILGVEVPAVPVVLEDAGRDPFGAVAETRAEGGVEIVLRTEVLVLGAVDLDATLLHEHFHALHRARLGERYRAVAPWAREGAAQYVAGQGAWRARLLAEHAKRHPETPLAEYGGRLEGPLPFERYGLAVAAFEAVEEGQGRGRALALARRLLDEPDARKAVEREIGAFSRFEYAARERARRVLSALLETHADHPYDLALKLHGRGEHRAALEMLGRLPRAETVLVGESVLLELRCLKALGDPGFEAALARARLDLTPFPQHAELDALAAD